MPVLFLESVPSANDAGWPTTPENVYFDDTLRAITTSNADECVYSGFNFDALPDSCTITGIRVRVDADFDNPGGATLTNGRYTIQLGWDGGTSYTTAFYTAVLVDDTERTSFLGGPLNTWGRTWSRSEFTSANFRLKATSTSVAFTGSPEWRCEFIQVAVYYTEDLQQSIFENLSLSDRVSTDPIYASIFELLSVEDARIDHSGTAITDLLSSAELDFDNAARYQRTEGCVVQFEFGAAGPILFIGDSAVVTDATDSSWIVKAAQPGLIGIDSITYSSDFGDEQRPAEAAIRLANKKYGDNFSGSSKTLPEHLQGKNLLGGKVTVYALVKGAAWYRRVIFVGRVLDMEVSDLEIVIRANQSGSGGIPVPDLNINENTFYYAENTYSGQPGREGNRIPEKIGAVIPIGVGRFNVLAVDQSWAAGHIMAVTSGKEKSATGVIAALCGIKYPMMPCVAAVRNWTGRHAELSVTGSRVYGRSSHYYQQVYLHGSRRGSKQILISHGAPDETDSYLFGESGFTTDQGTNLIPIYTWAKQDRAYDQALPFVRDNSPRSSDPSEFLKREDNWWLWQSAGGMDNSKGSDRWTDGEAKSAFGVFVNLALAPDNPDNLIKRPNSGGALQVVAVPFDSISAFVGWAAGDDYTHGLEGTDVFSSSSMLNLRDLKSAMRVHYEESGDRYGQASLEFRQEAPGLGDIWGIRVAGIYNTTDSSTGILAMKGRLAGPLWPTSQADRQSGSVMLRIPGIPGSDVAQRANLNQAQNTTLVPSGAVSGGDFMRPIAGQSYRYFAWWPFPPWRYDPAHPDGGALAKGWIQGSANDWGVSGPWEFTSWGYTTRDFNLIIKWPWDVVFQCRPTTAPPGDADGDVYINKAWLEVIFKSSIGSKTEEFTFDVGGDVRNPVITLPRFGVNWLRGQPTGGISDDIPPSADIFVSGDGPTQSGGTVVEKPADVAKLLLGHYGASQPVTGTDVFGSFDDANATAGTHRMALVVDRQLVMSEVMAEIARQSRAIIDEQITTTGELQYRMFIETDNPAADDPARIYRNDISFKFEPRDIYAEQFTCYSSEISQLSSNIRVKYGWHIPSSSWSGERFLTKEATNLATEASLYQTAAATTYTDYVQLDNPRVYEFPDIWDPAVADMLVKWLFNRQRRRLVTVDFTTYIRHSNIRVGHVIRFDDSIGDLVKYPGELGASTWSEKSGGVPRYFNVLGVSYSKDVDGFLRVKIMARECYTKPV